MAGIHPFRRPTAVVATVSLTALALAVTTVLFATTLAAGSPVVGRAGAEMKAIRPGIQAEGGPRFASTIADGTNDRQPGSGALMLGGQPGLASASRTLHGIVLDSSTSKPVAGALLQAGELQTQTDRNGSFKLTGIQPGAEVYASAEGYGRLVIQYEGQPAAIVKLRPNVLNIVAVDQRSGQPLKGAEVADGRSTVATNEQGEAQLRYIEDGATVTVTLNGFAPARITFAGQYRADVRLRPNTVTGVVRDSEGQPIAGALVSDGNSTVSTDQSGSFKLTGVPENSKLAVSASGFERWERELGEQTNLDITLKPFYARGLYLTFYGVGDEGLRNHVLHLADTTEVNAVVIDVKGDRGWIAYPSSVSLVKEIGAQKEIMIPDPKSFLVELKRRGIYTIARIVTFKDNPLATARPDLAAINANTGQPWVDNEGLRWTDPTRPEVWDYNIALAIEAIDNGFDEVQFDYVRFPTDASVGNSLDSIRFSQPNTMENRVAAINGFLDAARRAIKARGGVISADIFGYVVWRDDDMGIGQKLEEVAKRVDYVSPMVYPNLFWDGIAVEGGVKYANRRAGLYPYEIVYETMKLAVKRIGVAKLRPWLEYYDDYLTGKSYTADDIRVQKKATYENGVQTWLFWDPSNRFAKGGFEQQ